MPDAEADDDLRATLTAALARSRCTRPEPCDDCLAAAQDSAEDALPALTSYVAAQVGATKTQETP